MSRGDTIELRRTYDAPIDDVWELIATRDGLASWLMPNDFEPVLGHRFTFTDRPRRPFYDGIVGCEVLVIEPPRLLEISWTGGPVDTRVTFRLVAESDDRTRLELTHAGFRGLKGAAVRAILDLGWRDLLRRSLSRRLEARRA
jgi:uncharacterized protein YndB with AHSA1/START domain